MLLDTHSRPKALKAKWDHCSSESRKNPNEAAPGCWVMTSCCVGWDMDGMVGSQYGGVVAVVAVVAVVVGGGEAESFRSEYSRR